MKYVIAFLAAAFLAIVQVSIMPYIEVLGVVPDLTLIFAASWCVARGPEEGAIVTPMTGFLRDLATSDPLGTSVLAMAPIVLFAAAIRLRAIETEFVPAVLVVAFGTLAYGIISTIVLAITGQTVVWDQAMLRVALPACLVNALFTPLVYVPVHAFSRQAGTSIVGARRLTSPL